jgi:branched-chain amino acid transport system substrate-binding protein
MKLKVGIGKISLIILSLIILLLPICGCSQEQASEEVEIGALFTLSGPMSASFGRNADGVNAAAEWINEKGGISVAGKNYKIKIVPVDDGGTPDGAVAGMNQLVYDKKIKIMIVSPFPTFSIPSGEVSDAAQALRFKMGYMGLPGELTSYTIATHSEQPFVPDVFKSFVATYPNVKTIACIAPNDTAGLDSQQIDIQEAQKNGLSVVLEDTFEADATDYYPLCTKIIAAKPDAVSIAVGIPAWFGGILKQLRELGYNGPVFVPVNSADINLIKQIAGASATDYFGLDIDPLSPDMPPIIKEIGSIIESKYNTELTVDHIYGWEALWDVAQAIESAQSFDPTVIRDTVQKMKSIETPYGSGTIGGEATYGFNNVIVRPQPIIRIMNGEVIMEEWLNPILP